MPLNRTVGLVLVLHGIALLLGWRAQPGINGLRRLGRLLGWRRRIGAIELDRGVKMIEHGL